MEDNLWDAMIEEMFEWTPNHTEDEYDIRDEDDLDWVEHALEEEDYEED